MLVYRLAKEKYIHDLQAMGGLYGAARWHETGTRVLYTAEVFSLSKLEVLANSEELPKNMAVIVIEIPDDVSIKELKAEDLPANWDSLPYLPELQQMSKEWIKENKHLVMKVPSVHSPYESNYLINPLHPDHGRLKVVEVKEHIFDKRLKPEGAAAPEEELKPKPKRKANETAKGVEIILKGRKLNIPRSK